MKLYFKHSPICTVSRAAKGEVELFLEEFKKDINYEYVNVPADRKRSKEITERFGIKHESPQVIIVDKNGSLIWNGSHFDINAERIISSLGHL